MSGVLSLVLCRQSVWFSWSWPDFFERICLTRYLGFNFLCRVRGVTASRLLYNEIESAKPLVCRQHKIRWRSASPSLVLTWITSITCGLRGT